MTDIPAGRESTWSRWLRRPAITKRLRNPAGATTYTRATSNVSMFDFNDDDCVFVRRYRFRREVFPRGRVVLPRASADRACFEPNRAEAMASDSFWFDAGRLTSAALFLAPCAILPVQHHSRSIVVIVMVLLEVLVVPMEIVVRRRPRGVTGHDH